MSKAKSSLTRDTLTGMFWVTMGRGGRAVLQLVVLSILARLLTPAQFGVVSAALVVIGFSAIFSEVGLGPAIVQRPDLEPRHIKAAFAGSVLFGLIVGFLVWLVAPAAAAFFQIAQVEPVLRVLAWIFPLKGIAVVPESLLQRDLNFRLLANRDVVSYAVGYGLVGVMLAWAGAGVWALVAGQMTQAALNTGLLLLARPQSLSRRIEWAACRELALFGGGFTAARVSNYFAVQGDNLVVGRWLGPQALGIYGRAYQLMAMPAVVFGTILDTVLFPVMARVQGEAQQLRTAYRRGVSLIALVMLPASVLLFVLAPELVGVLLGPKWLEAIAPFQVLSIGLLFRTSYKMSDSISRATGAVYRRAWRQGVYAFLVIGGAWVGQHWGVEYVAWGVVGALAINFLLMAQLSLSVSGMTWGSFFAAHEAALGLAAVSGIATWSAVTLLRRWDLPAAVRLAAAGSLALLVVALLTSRLPRVFLGVDGRWIVDVLRAYLPKRFQLGRFGETDAADARATAPGAPDVGPA